MKHVVIKAHGRPQPTPSLDRFAELLAREITPPNAAEMMGHRREYGRVMLRKICKRLGAQAV